MADQAVDVLLVAEIEGVILVAVSRMALGAHPFVAARIGAEVVDQNTLSKFLFGDRMGVFPGPVLVFDELLSSPVVAFETGFGDFRAAEKRAGEFLEGGVICG